MTARESSVSGVERIARERRRQIEEEGWTAEHDDQHDRGELAIAAGCCALSGTDAYPVDPGWTGKTWMEQLAEKHQHDEIRSLEIAGALIAAEIDRLERAEASDG